MIRKLNYLKAWNEEKNKDCIKWIHFINSIACKNILDNEIVTKCKKLTDDFMEELKCNY